MPPPNKQLPTRTTTSDKVKTALKRRSGVTIPKISKAVGASRATIYRVLDTPPHPAPEPDACPASPLDGG